MVGLRHGDPNVNIAIDIDHVDHAKFKYFGKIENSEKWLTPPAVRRFLGVMWVSYRKYDAGRARCQ